MNYEPHGYVESLSNLPIEYERMYGSAIGNGKALDIMDDSFVLGPRGIDGLLNTEQVGDLGIFESGPLGDDPPHS